MHAKHEEPLAVSMLDHISIYDYLPNAVIVFDAGRVEYMNTHLLDILNISFLDKAARVEVLRQTLGLQSGENLLEYLMQREYFWHRNKVIQIEHSRHGEVDIFSFMLLLPALLREGLEAKALQAAPLVIDTKIAGFFKQKNIKKLKVLTFFKGLPLKNFAKIVRIGKDSIELEVDKKHKVSLQESDEIFLITDERKGSKILQGHVVEHANTLFSVKNFSLTDTDKHLREELRFKEKPPTRISVDGREFGVYDLSEKGISVHVQSEDDVNFLKKQKQLSLLLEQKTLNLKVLYLKTAYQEEKALKVIFKTAMTDKNFVMLRHYLISRQSELIREIHAFRL